MFFCLRKERFCIEGVLCGDVLVSGLNVEVGVWLCVCE